MPDPEKDADPDKRFVSQREDVTLLVLADLPFLKETEKLAPKEKFAMEKETVFKSLPESKLPLHPFFLKKNSVVLSLFETKNYYSIIFSF